MSEGRSVKPIKGLPAAAAATAGLARRPVPGGAQAADNPTSAAPPPTSASIEATRGPFATRRPPSPRCSVTGFGGGTIYYPTSTAEGTFGAVAISPGFTADQSSIAWLGPRLASQGFVVITIDTITTYDQPASRGTPAAGRAGLPDQQQLGPHPDRRNRLAVMGHSMGGGGTPGGRQAPPVAAGGHPADRLEHRQDLVRRCACRP